MNDRPENERSPDEVRYRRIAFPQELLEAGERVMAKIYEKRDQEQNKQTAKDK